MLDWLSPDRQEWLVLTLIPLAAAATGWLSTQAARFLMHYPMTTIGKPPWLGIRGRLHHEQAECLHTLERTLREHLITLPQLYELLGPEKTVQQVVQGIRPQLDSLIDDIMLAHHSILWENLPVTVKNRYYARAHRMIPRIIDDIVEEMGDNVERLLDLPAMLARYVDNHRAQYNELYGLLTRSELSRLTWAAAFFQFVLATALGYAWIWWSVPWLYPAGLTCGALLTGWLWHQTRLRATHRNRITLGSQLDLNAFLERLSHTMLAPGTLVSALLNGNKSRHTRLLIKRHVNAVLDEVALRTFSQITMGPEGYADIKLSLSERIPQLYEESVNDVRFNHQRSRVLAVHLVESSTHQAALLYNAFSRPYFSHLQTAWALLLTASNAGLGLCLLLWL